MTKTDICNRIIEEMQKYKPSEHKTAWADDINQNTAERVIDVMQNVVRGIRDSRQRKES